MIILVVDEQIEIAATIPGDACFGQLPAAEHDAIDVGSTALDGVVMGPGCPSPVAAPVAAVSSINRLVIFSPLERSRASTSIESGDTVWPGFCVVCVAPFLSGLMSTSIPPNTLVIRAATISASGSLLLCPTEKRVEAICNNAIGSSAPGAFGPLAMLTPFCGEGAGPSDPDPASSGELMLNPTARLATTKRIWAGQPSSISNPGGKGP